MNIKEFRTQYPQYGDMDDVQLTNALHEAHYSDIPYEDFTGIFWKDTEHDLGDIDFETDLDLDFEHPETDEELISMEDIGWPEPTDVLIPTREEARAVLEAQLKSADQLRKGFKKAFVHGWKRGGVREVRGLAGNALAVGEILAPDAFDYRPPKRVYDPVTGKVIRNQKITGTLGRPAREQFDMFGRRRTKHGDSLALAMFAMTHQYGKPLREWSREMLAGVDKYYKEHPEEAMSLQPDIGFAETLKWAISNPDELLQLNVESLPFMLRMVLGYKMGGPFSAGKPAAIANVAMPVAGNIYADARKEGTMVVPALGQAMLVGLGEGALEEWAFGRLFGLSKNIKKILAKGLPKILWEGAKVYGRGTVEEGSQQFNENLWRWFFTDRGQKLMENVPESAALGGPMELTMGSGFAAAGMVTGPSMTAEKQYLLVDKIRKGVNENKDLSEEHKKEINAELDQVEKDIEMGYYDIAGASAKRAELKAKAKYKQAVQEAGLEPEPKKEAKPRTVTPQEAEAVTTLQQELKGEVPNVAEDQQKVFNEMVEKIQPQQEQLSNEQKVAQEIMNTLGYETVFIEGAEMFNASVVEGDTNRIFIDKGTSNPVLTAGMHEVNHQLQKEFGDSKQYKLFINTLRMSVVSEKLTKYGDKLNKDRKRYGMKELKPEEILQEFAGDFMGDAAKTETFWNIIVEKDTNLFRKLAKLVRRMLKNLWDTDKKTFKLIHAGTIERNIQNAAKLAKVKLSPLIAVQPEVKQEARREGPETRAGPKLQVKPEGKVEGLKGTPTQTFLEPSERMDLRVPRNDVASKENPLVDSVGNEFYKSDGFWIWRNPNIEDKAFAGWTTASPDFNKKAEKWYQSNVSQPTPVEGKVEGKPTKLEQERAIQKLVNMGRNPLEARRKIEAFPDAKTLKNFMRLIETEGGAKLQVKNKQQPDPEQLKNKSKFQIKPWYYSKLEQAVDEMPSSVQNAQVLESYLKNKGVKDAEMFWRGIYDLAEGKITKEDLQKHLAEHNIVVDEVWKSQRGVDDYGNAYEEDLDPDLDWSDGEAIEPDSDSVNEDAYERMEQDKSELLEEEKGRITNALSFYHSDEEIADLENQPLPNLNNVQRNTYDEARERYINFFINIEQELEAQTVARDIWDDEGLWEEIKDDSRIFDDYYDRALESAYEFADTEYTDEEYGYIIVEDYDGGAVLKDPSGNYIEEYQTIEEAKRAAYDIELEKQLEHEPTPAEETEKTLQGSYARPEAARYAEPGYREPGGQDYYELVLTLQDRQPVPVENMQVQEGEHDYKVTLGQHTVNVGKGVVNSKEAAIEYAKPLIVEKETKAIQKRSYTGGHYKEENVVVHIRFNTRIDSDGNKVLFIEEIQSDWAQRGRKYGFKSEAGPEIARLHREVADKEGEIVDYVDSLFSEQRKTVYGLVRTADYAEKLRVARRASEGLGDEAAGVALDVHNETTKLATLWVERGELLDQIHNYDQALPDMPFKQNWIDLALKRILYHAAEHDFDKVAWTTGDMQVKRWSGALQKQVDRISYFPETQMLVATKSGREVFKEEVSRGKVGDYIGSELATSLFRSQDKETGVYGISGDSLKFGGASMRITYDQAIPKFMNKLAKKKNAKVEVNKIGPTQETSPGYKPSNPQYMEVLSITISPQLKTFLLDEGSPLFQMKPFEQSALAPLMSARDLAMNLNDLAEFKARLRGKRASVEQMQAELNNYIVKRLPRKFQAVPLKKLQHISIHHRDETNKKKIVEIIGTVEGIVVDQARRDAIQSLKNTWRKTKKKYGGRSLNKLPNEIRNSLIDRMEEVNLISLTEEKKGDIAKAMQKMRELAVDLSQGVMNIENLSPDDLSNLEEALKIPSARLVQLQRLAGKNAKEMMPADIRVIEEGIQNIIHEYETKRFIESENRRVEFTEAKEKIKGEIIPTRKALRRRKKEARGKAVDITKGDKSRFVKGIVHTESAHLETLIEQIGSQNAAFLKKYLVDDLYAGQQRMYQQLFAAVDFLKREMAAMKMTRREIKALENKVSIQLGKKRLKVPLDYLVSLDRSVARPENLRNLLRTQGLKMGDQTVMFDDADREALLPQLQAAVQQLTDKQRQFGTLYNKMNALINAPAINEVNLQLAGYEIARDPLYFPEHRVVPKKLPGKAMETARAIEQQGRYQAKVPNINPLEIKPFTEELMTAIQTDATFVGMALPMKNARTILHDADIQNEIVSAGHKKALKAVMTILKRAQGVSTDKNIVEMFGQKLMSRAVKSILSLRFSTIGTQVMSVPAAMSEIDPHHFVGLFPPSPQLIKKLKQDPFFRMRWDGGRIDIDVGNIMAQHTLDTLLFGKYPVSEKTLRGLVHGDQVAIGYIFKAARREVAAANPNLKGPALNQAAIERTKQVMRRTQPMWDILNRSVLGSSPNVLLRSLLIFRSAREAQLNIGIRANNDLLKGGSIYQWSKAMASLTGSAMAVAAWKALFKWAVMTGILIALGIKRPEEEEEVQKTVVKIATDTGKNVISLVPFGGIISNWIETAARSAFTGKRRLPSNYNRNIFENMMQAFGVAVVDLLAGWHKYATGDEEGGKKAIHNAIDNAINFTALISGLPYSGPQSEFYKPYRKAMEQTEEWKY